MPRFRGRGHPESDLRILPRRMGPVRRVRGAMQSRSRSVMDFRDGGRQIGKMAA
jgi:hypothetical protein